MKPHKFVEDYDAAICFGSPLFKCKSCDAISLDLELTPYSDPHNWLTVSVDCERAGKQIELIQRQEEITASRELYFCW